MARIRTIKPEFFRHEVLQDLEVAHPGAYIMLVFAGLWGHCDRAGRFEWRPRQLKLDILPFLPFDMSETLALLEEKGFLTRYTVDGREYGEIPSFEDHQRIGGKEAQEPSKIPAPCETTVERVRSTGEATGKQRGSTGEAVVKHLGLQEGKGMEEEEEGKRLLSGAPAPAQPEEAPPDDGDVHEEPPPFITLPTNRTGLEYPVSHHQVTEFAALYPAVDVEQAFRNMRGWLQSNPQRRKTIRGMPAFMNSWLSREQNNPKRPSNGTPNATTGKRNYCPTPESDLARRKALGIA